MNKRFRYLLLWGLLCLPLAAVGAQSEHDHEPAAGEAHDGYEGEPRGGHEENEGGVVAMSARERKAQGLETAVVGRQTLGEEVLAPGEVVLNAYRTSQVTPRISGQILERHARLGDRVKTGQTLVTLSSVQMADAQGELLVADREWQRVRKLGRNVVSEARYIQAQVARQQAYATVLAYGMPGDRIEALLRAGDVSRATGEFDLLAPQDGTVLSDDFVIGEVVEPGRVLMEISDESVLWVEARLSPEDAGRVLPGARARVRAGSGPWLDARVIQHHHRLDEVTRTQAVRLEIDNRDDVLHPGQFLDVALPVADAAQLVAVPASAVLLMQGSPVVFKVEGDEMHPVPVETGPTRGGWTEIRAGLAEGDEIVVKGVFLLKSLVLKSQMGEGHAH